MEEKSFGSSHVMQVIYTDDTGRPQTAYLQCKVWPWAGVPWGRGAVGGPWVGWMNDSPSHVGHSKVREM